MQKVQICTHTHTLNLRSNMCKGVDLHSGSAARNQRTVRKPYSLGMVLVYISPFLCRSIHDTSTSSWTMVLRTVDRVTHEAAGERGS